MNISLIGWLFAAVFACYGAVLSFMVFPTKVKVEKVISELSNCQRVEAREQATQDKMIESINQTLNRHEVTVKDMVGVQVAVARIEKELSITLPRMEKKLDSINGKS
jgi:hypothetical protein